MAALCRQHRRHAWRSHACERRAHSSFPRSAPHICVRTPSPPVTCARCPAMPASPKAPQVPSMLDRPTPDVASPPPVPPDDAPLLDAYSRPVIDVLNPLGPTLSPL